MSLTQKSGSGAASLDTIVRMRVLVVEDAPHFERQGLRPSGDFGNKSPLTNFSDDLSWTHGAHAFKGGIEFRYAYTAGYQPTPVTTPTLGSIVQKG